MRKSNVYKRCGCILAALFLSLSGCSKESNALTEQQQASPEPSSPETTFPEESFPEPSSPETAFPEVSSPGESFPERSPAQAPSPEPPSPKTDESQKVLAEPIITKVDWSDYFDGINGAAVIYDPAENRYQIYNQELALIQRSPCSTFKIISSLIALENGIIDPDNSVRTWSGERFWNEEWNKDIDFPDAFHASCVWYFREIIDEIGKEKMQEELNRLNYGNRDISDWQGQLNTNNHNPVLTGFWIESSLLISPKEQAEVMERIFGDTTDYSEKTLTQLKQVMLLTEQNETNHLIYGKTGMGKAYGIVVDAWYTGFADTANRRI